MATIEKRTTAKGQVKWAVKVRIQGHPRVYRTFSRKTDAEAEAAEIERQIKRGTYSSVSESQKVTVGEMLGRYRKQIERDPAKVRAGRLNHLDWFDAQAGKYALSALTPAMIVKLRDKLGEENNESGRQRSPATVNRYLATLSDCLTLAVNEWGLLPESPMRKVRRKKEPKGRVRFLSDTERDALLHACQESESPELYPVIVLALATGMRQSEILDLTRDRIDLNRGWITLEDTKNDSRRGVPLVGPAVDAMRQLDNVRRIDGRLFPPRNGSGLGNLRGPWKKALEEAKIENFKFHDLRHSAASYMAMSGMGLLEIAAQLGHKTLAMVQRYSHLADDHRARQMEKMAGKFLGGTY